MSALFFGLSLTAAVGYALNNVFLARFSRKIDGLSLTVYRNTSFFITMSPVLLFVEWNDIQRTLSAWEFLLGAGFFGALGNACMLNAQKYLPIGIVSGFGQILPIYLLLWSYLFFGETISGGDFFSILIIILAAIFLGAQNHHLPHLNAKTRNGIFFVLASTFFGSLTFFLMSIVAREGHPFAAGYFWEVSIGLFAILFVFLRKQLGYRGIEKISRESFLKIAIYVFPTVIASTCLPFAMTLGPAAIAYTITGGSFLVFVSILSLFMHKEPLGIRQITPLIVIFIGILGIRFKWEKIWDFFISLL